MNAPDGSVKVTHGNDGTSQCEIMLLFSFRCEVVPLSDCMGLQVWVDMCDLLVEGPKAV